MKSIFFSTFFFAIAFTSFSPKIEKEKIWEILYPDNQKFDELGRLVRNIKRDGKTIRLRSAIHKIFYYNSSKSRKALVLFFSYNHNTTTGNNEDCNLCKPEFDLAYFSYQNNNWLKEKFIKNWEGSDGANGEGAQVEKSFFKNNECLAITSSYFARGTVSTTTNYYNIENLIHLGSTETDE